MKVEELQGLFEDEKYREIAFEGKCHDCQKDVTVIITMQEDGFKIDGGAVYKVSVDEEYKGINKYYLKCDDCFGKKLELDNFQKCEIYSRVVGYLRPTNQWNPGKLQEFKDRKYFDIKTDEGYV